MNLLWKKTIAVFLFTFLLGYILISGVIWFQSLTQTERYAYDSTRAYIKKHKNDIVHTVFAQIFSDAKQCVNTLPSNKTKCEKEVTHHLAITIIEEDFKNQFGVDWPTDLFFVKETPTETARLGWEGKYINITKTYQKSWISSPLFLRSFFNKCHIFNDEQMSATNCEIYEKIPLAKNETGYVVRLIGIDDVGDKQFALTIPLLIIINTPAMLVSLPEMYRLHDPYLFNNVLPFFLVMGWILLSIGIAYLYYRRQVGAPKKRNQTIKV